MNQRPNTNLGSDLLAFSLGLFLAVSLSEWSAAVVLDDPSVAMGRLANAPGMAGSSNLRYWIALALALGGITLVAVRRAGNVSGLAAGKKTNQGSVGTAKQKGGTPNLSTGPGPLRWFWILPLVWFAWQFLAAGQSIELKLTTATMKHFFSCIACYFVGWLTFSRARSRAVALVLVTGGLLLALWNGFTQKYGGLRETREFYEQAYRGELSPDLQVEFNTPEFRTMFEAPGFQKRINSERIYSTLTYPNSFAGAILLLLPMSLALVHQFCRRASFVLRATLVGVLGYAGVACLIWSGSKAGWLVALALIALATLQLFRSTVTPALVDTNSPGVPAKPGTQRADRRRHINPSDKEPQSASKASTSSVDRSAGGVHESRRLLGAGWGIRAGIIGLVCLVGLAGFFAKYSDYFRRGAPSVGARFGYWTAAFQTAAKHPLLGTGPGTFSVSHAQVKDPEAEMARLAHNDYLEQASDSGWVGLISYTMWIFGALGFVFRRGFPDVISFGLWLGCVGFALQSLVEFGLYVPALAWPAMVFLGGLVGNHHGFTRG